MTQQELRDFTFQLTDTMIRKNCYIKGYGKLYRVMDQHHNPEINITKTQFDTLRLNKIVQPAGLIWTLAVIANPY